MKTVVADPDLVAYCGLYCGACGKYLREQCPGCHGNAKATWCQVRRCCMAAGRASCAECRDFSDPRDCAKFNNFIAKVFGLVFRSDRRACIRQIRAKGLDGHAADMAAQRRPSIRRGRASA